MVSGIESPLQSKVREGHLRHDRDLTNQWQIGKQIWS